MKSTPRSARTLAATAALILLAGLGTWFATGRHVGWTQTSVVTVQHDEITGIDYPVRRDAFVAGVEIPALAFAAAGTFAAAAWWLQRRATVRA